MSSADRSASAALPALPGLLAALRRRRRGASLAAHLILSAAALAVAFVVRFEMEWPGEYTRTYLVAVGPLLALRAAAALGFRLHTHRWRFTTTRDMVDVLFATAVTSFVFFWIAHHWLPVDPTLRVPRSVVFLEFVFASYLFGGVRVVYRLVYEWLRSRRAEATGDRRKVLVVGAGEAGNRIVREMKRYPGHGYRPVGLVDDDPARIGARVQGTPVLGPVDDLPDLASRTGADLAVLALPSASPEELRRIVEVCSEAELEAWLLPPAREVMEGRVELGQLRELRVEDLLAREPVDLRVPEVAERLEGRRAWITGAAGSIGSELARQTATYRPAELVLVDQAETALFLLERELSGFADGGELVTSVTDVLDGPSLDRLFADHPPERVYHAAAYKHVPLMEANPRAAVLNNVLGTWEVARRAGEAGASHFVLVSTDKAVRPTSVMGATKRVAEMLVLELGERYPETSFRAVRFGNVIGSQGSVVPLFRRQISEGGPVTVTHPEASRFFMTIPEAVQLVLRASVLPGARDHVTMLEMGEPVNIDELARTLLRLSGVSADRAEEMIEYVGLRPGEKLHEELTGPGEETAPTEAEKIRVVKRTEEMKGKEPGRVSARVEEWKLLLASGEDERVIRELWEICGEERTP